MIRNHVHGFALNSTKPLGIINRVRAEHGQEPVDTPILWGRDETHLIRLALGEAAYALGEKPPKRARSPEALKAAVVRECYARARAAEREAPPDRERPKGMPTRSAFVSAIPIVKRRSTAAAVNEAAMAVADWIDGKVEEKATEHEEWRPAAKIWDLVVRRLEATVLDPTKGRDSEALAVLRIDGDGKSFANKRIAVKLTEVTAKMVSAGGAENAKTKLYEKMVAELESHGIEIPLPAAPRNRVYSAAGENLAA